MIARLLISSSLEIRKKELEKILIDHNLASHPKGANLNHPDLLYFPDDSKLGIEQARKIKEHFSLKPYSAKGRVVVLENASNLTVEAQNALLKILEELPNDALFILGTDSDSKLLPTVVSRCQVIILSDEKYNSYNYYNVYTKDLENLLKADFEERFEYIEKLKDREEFLKALLHYFYQTLNAQTGFGNSNIEFLKELLRAEEYQKQNVNIRAILEYLMLKMPQKL